MYGTQTLNHVYESPREFENDVKMYGTQTDIVAAYPPSGLRMM